MTIITRLIVLAAVCYACQEARPPGTSVVKQETKIANAVAELSKEKLKLKSLKDSLNIRIQENVTLGMSDGKARKIEEALIQVQQTVVTASEVNLSHQRELLAIMKTGQP